MSGVTFGSWIQAEQLKVAARLHDRLVFVPESKFIFCYTHNMINKWHELLDMPKHNEAWHLQDLSDEMEEYSEATSILNKWSELSDVVYTCTRGRWSGHKITFRFSKYHYALGVLYMVPKYTARWLFFRSAGKKAHSTQIIHEVRNPKKTHKLDSIAQKYNIDPRLFRKICERQLKYWFLLP